MSTPPSFPTWRPLLCEHKPVLDGFCRSYAPYAEATLATLLVWNEVDECQITHLNGNIVLRHRSCGGGPVVTVLGHHRSIETAVALVQADIGALRLVPDYSIAGAEAASWASAELVLIADRDNDDYVFDTRRLAQLSGPDLKGRRQRCGRFVRSHKPQLVRLDLTSMVDIREIMGCVESWFGEQSESADELPTEELAGLERLLDLTRRRGLEGLEAFGVRVGGEVVATSIVETHGTDMVSGVVFKASRRLAGSGEFLRSASAEALVAMGFRWINAQQDLGRPGLRDMKSSYRPAAMLRKWSIERRDSPTC